MTAEDRILSGVPDPEDLGVEPSLRPQRLEEYIGQKKVIDNLRVFIRAARERRRVARPRPPVRPARASARRRSPTSSPARWGRPCASPRDRCSSAPGDLAAILTNLEPGEVLFIDEIHRLGPTVEEILYPALEDFRLDLVIGQGPAARTVKIELPRFTLVGATTRAGLISAAAARPLRHRPPPRLLPPGGADARSSSARPGCSASRSTPDGADGDRPPQPRHAARRQPPAAPGARLRPGRARAKRDRPRQSPRRRSTLLEVDEFGFDDVDRKILSTLIEHYDGGPAGIKALAVAVGEDRGTIEDLYEPYLIQEGFLQRTPRGRVATRRAYQHLGYPPPPRHHRDAVLTRSRRAPRRPDLQPALGAPAARPGRWTRSSPTLRAGGLRVEPHAHRATRVRRPSSRASWRARPRWSSPSAATARCGRWRPACSADSGGPRGAARRHGQPAGPRARPAARPGGRRGACCGPSPARAVRRRPRRRQPVPDDGLGRARRQPSSARSTPASSGASASAADLGQGSREWWRYPYPDARASSPTASALEATFAAVAEHPLLWRAPSGSRPEARPDDGWLELVLFRGTGRAGHAVASRFDLFRSRPRPPPRRGHPPGRARSSSPGRPAPPAQVDGDLCQERLPLSRPAGAGTAVRAGSRPAPGEIA